MKLQAIQIEKSYKSRKVVDGVDIELNQGEIVGLLGPNGAGKTTCFYMIVGLIKSNSGKILIDDIDVSDEPMYKKYMSKGYIHFFSGSIIEANNLTTKLSENKIKYILKDDHYSATLAGFGASNYLNSCKIFIKKEDLDLAKMIYKN